MPRMTEAVLADFLREPHVGVIASLRKDGRPYTVPVWWLYEDGGFWLTGTSNRIWCQQLKADGRCSLCVEAMTPVAGHVGVDGIATAHELPDFDIWPVSRQLAEKYVGRGEPANETAVDKFFANMQTEPRLLFRLEAQVWRAIDMRVYRGKRADRSFQDQHEAGKQEQQQEQQ